MDKPNYIIKPNIYIYFLIGIVPFILIELFIYDFNILKIYVGITTQNDKYLLYAISASIFMYSYMYIEILVYKDKLMFKKRFWFRNRHFEIRIDQIQEIKFYEARGEFIDIMYLKDGKNKKKRFEFWTFRSKKLKKIIDSISAEIEINK